MKEILIYIENFFNKIIDFDYIWFLINIWDFITLEWFLKFIIVYFFVIWISIIIWVTRDIINRTNNIFFQIISILIVLFWTPLWVVIYLLIRPSKTLFEKYYEEASLEEVIDDVWENKKALLDEDLKCHYCFYPIKKEYKFCPNCRKKLKEECIWCWRELKPEWKICPFCWKDQENKVEKILSKKEDKKSKKIDKQKK